MTAAAAAGRALDVATEQPAFDASVSPAAQHQHLTAERQQHQQRTFIRQLVSSWQWQRLRSPGTDTRDIPSLMHLFISSIR